MISFHLFVYFVNYLFQRGKLVSSLSQRDDPDGATLSTPIVSDRSPLIQHASSPPPLIVDATAFDNEAVVAETTSTSAVDRKLTDSPSEPEIGRSVVGKEAPASSSKKRKVLSIVSRVKAMSQYLVTPALSDRLYKCSAVAKIGDRSATTDMGRIVGAVSPFSGVGSWVPI